MGDSVTPPWLNKEFITSVLEENNDHIEKIKIISLDLQTRLGSNKNHFSNIYKIKLQLNLLKNKQNKSEFKYLFIKERNSDMFIKSVVERGKFVEKEFLMYKEILPLMSQKMKDFKISPQYYPSKFPNIFIMDDLQEQGYVMRDRLTKLDFEHSEMFMKTIATFHAVSISVHRQNPIMIMSVGEDYLHNIEDSCSPDFVSNWFTKFYQVVQTWEGCERFGDKIRKQLNTFPEHMIEIFTPRDHFNVLNHGDTWTNNILYKYDTRGSITDVKLVDYQVCRFGSLGLDLQYFIWTSVQEEVRNNRLQELYSVYIQTLNTHLEHLGCEERLTRDQFYEEMDFTGVFILYIVIFVLPFILSDEDDVTKLEEDDYLMINDNLENDRIQKIFKGRHFKSTVKVILCQLEKQGII